MTGSGRHTDRRTIPIFFIIYTPPVLNQSGEFLNCRIELTVHIELTRKFGPEYTDIAHHIKCHDDNDGKESDREEHFNECEPPFSDSFPFFYKCLVFSENIMEKGGNTSTNLHPRRSSPKALGTDVKNKIHTVEETVFSEGRNFISDDNFDEECEAQQKGNKEVPYQNDEDIDGVFFEGFAFHR